MDKEPSDTATEIESIIPDKPSLLKNLLLKIREYFFQFFMLFLAITAGFFADNLREDFSERKQSAEYAKSMIDDLVRDTLNINYHISRLKTAVSNITDLADYARDKQVSKMNNLDLYRLTLITWNPPFRWSRATLEQIKSSGSLRYFTNDSIIFYISQYDAVTLHLDQDNLEDQQRYSQAIERRSEVVDLNYKQDFLNALKSNPDSMKQTPAYFEMSSSRQLLTDDISKVRSMINAYLVARDYSNSRIKELSRLVHDQGRLIQLLKHEYKLR